MNIDNRPIHLDSQHPLFPTSIPSKALAERCGIYSLKVTLKSNVLLRINRNTVEPEFKMKMGTGG